MIKDVNHLPHLTYIPWRSELWNRRLNAKSTSNDASVSNVFRNPYNFG